MELERVLLEGAYMLLYARYHVCDAQLAYFYFLFFFQNRHHIQNVTIILLLGAIHESVMAED